MNLKNKFREKLVEAKYIVKPENLDDVADKMSDTDTVKIVDESEDDPCWDSHKQVGMKDKGGKQVPNCVPVSEEHNGNISPLKLDPEFEKLSKSEEGVNEYEMVKPKMTKGELQETVKKILNNGK